MTDVFTCVTCNIAFNDADFQREHYKSDWHRYNLKRKVAELNPVEFKDFMTRVQAQKAESENAKNNVNQETFCKLCSKHFTSVNSFANHKQSKKHKDLEAFVLNTKKSLNNIQPTEIAIVSSNDTNTPNSTVDAVTSNQEDLISCKSDRAAKKAIQLEEQAKKFAAEKEENMEINEANEQDEGEEQEWEDIADDSDLMEETGGIEILKCFFCSHTSNTAEEKCEHMAKEHSFYIPSLDHVSDLEGLLKFLGIKLGVYHVCFWCSSKCYRDLLSVQRHMTDKGHQKLKFEGDTLIEYADFYSFGDDEDEETIDDEYDIVNKSALSESRLSKISSDEDNGDSYDEEMFELCLPSGARIGHRSLFRYYKQSFGHRNLEMKQRNNISIKDKYKAIALGGTYTQVEVQKQQKDMAYFKRWSAKMHAKLGWKANKLQKHFRRQDICF